MNSLNTFSCSWELPEDKNSFCFFVGKVNSPEILTSALIISSLVAYLKEIKKYDIIENNILSINKFLCDKFKSVDASSEIFVSIGYSILSQKEGGKYLFKFLNAGFVCPIILRKSKENSSSKFERIDRYFIPANLPIGIVEMDKWFYVEMELFESDIVLFCLDKEREEEIIQFINQELNRNSENFDDFVFMQVGKEEKISNLLKFNSINQNTHQNSQTTKELKSNEESKDKKNYEFALKFHEQLMPEVEEYLDWIEYYGISKPSEQLGGDFFKVNRIDNNHIRFIIGDTAGSGNYNPIVTSFILSLFEQNKQEDIEFILEKIHQEMKILRNKWRSEFFLLELYIGQIKKTEGRINISIRGVPGNLFFNLEKNKNYPDKDRIQIGRKNLCITKNELEISIEELSKHPDIDLIFYTDGLKNSAANYLFQNQNNGTIYEMSNNLLNRIDDKIEDDSTILSFRLYSQNNLSCKESDFYFKRGYDFFYKYNYKTAYFALNRSIQCEINCSIEKSNTCKQIIKNYLYRGMAQLERHYYKESILDLTRVIESNSIERLRFKAFINRSKAYLKIYSFHESIADAQSARSIFPDLKESYICLGDIYFELLEYEKAREFYVTAKEIDEKDGILFIKIGLTEIYNTKSLKEMEKFLVNCDQGVEKTKEQDNDKIIRKRLAEAYLLRGMARMNLDKNDMAMDDLNKSIYHYSNNYLSYYKRGILKQSVEKYKDAIFDFEKSIELNPKYFLAYSDKAYSLYYLDKNEKSKINNLYELCFELIEKLNIKYDFNMIYKEIATAYRDKGWICYQYDETEEAIRYTDVSIKFNEKNDDSYNRKAIILGNSIEAISYYTQAISINNLSSTLYCNRGYANMKLNDMNGAIQDYYKSIRINPEYIRGHKELFKLLIKISKYKNAFKLLQRFTKKNQDNSVQKLYYSLKCFIYNQWHWTKREEDFYKENILDQLDDSDREELSKRFHCQKNGKPIHSEELVPPVLGFLLAAQNKIQFSKESLSLILPSTIDSKNNEEAYFNVKQILRKEDLESIQKISFDEDGWRPRLPQDYKPQIQMKCNPENQKYWSQFERLIARSIALEKKDKKEIVNIKYQTLDSNQIEQLIQIFEDEMERLFFLDLAFPNQLVSLLSNKLDDWKEIVTEVNLEMNKRDDLYTEDNQINLFSNTNNFQSTNIDVDQDTPIKKSKSIDTNDLENISIFLVNYYKNQGKEISLEQAREMTNNSLSETQRQQILDYMKQYESIDTIPMFNQTNNDIEILLGRAEARAYLKEYELAIQDYTEVIRMDSKNKRAYLGRAKCYKILGNREEFQSDQENIFYLELMNILSDNEDTNDE